MTNRELYRDFLQQLQQIYTAGEASIITHWVFEKVATLVRADIIKNPGQEIPVETAHLLNQCLSALLLHKPVQYVLGEAWFYKMKLAVNEHVLIPRPETEELVQLVIDEYRNTVVDNVVLNASVPTGLFNPAPMILDIGTGSGCIAIAVKKALSRVSMYAMDISPDALSMAGKNAGIQGTDIHFLLADFLDEGNWQELPVFDIIISNPPYIPLNEKTKLDRNVTAFEPHGALFVPENDPLLFYKKIAAFGENHLQMNGTIFMEVHEDFARESAAVFEPSYKVAIKNDLLGKARMLTARKFPSA